MGQPDTINASQERIDEMNKIKADNQKILDDINTGRAAIKQERSAFDQYKDAENQKLQSVRDVTARESANHAKLDTVALQNQIEDLNKDNADLKAQLAELTQDNADLKAQLAATKK